MVQQSTNNIFENVYKFNGKELDESTGYYYYGARYYDPAISIFLSVDPLAEKYPSWNPYAYTFNNPIRYTDPTGMEGEDVITKVSNIRGDAHYKQRDVSMTVTLTILNSEGVDLSKTMFNEKSGTVALNALSGNAQMHYSSVDMMTSDNLSVSVDYKVVNSLKDIGENDHVMLLVQSIPQVKNTKVDPVGLADMGGRVSAVEIGTINNGTFNEVATHELGHNLGLQHRKGGLMNEAINGSTTTTTRERGEIVGGGYGPLGPKSGNGTYKQSNLVKDNYKESVSTQAKNFINKNNIK